MAEVKPIQAGATRGVEVNPPSSESQAAEKFAKNKCVDEFAADVAKVLFESFNERNKIEFQSLNSVFRWGGVIRPDNIIHDIIAIT